MPNFDTKWWVLFPPLQTVLSNTVRYWKKLRGFKADLIHLINPWEAPTTSNCCFKASLRSMVSEVIHEHLNQSLASVPEVFQIVNIHLLLQLSVSISFISLSEKVICVSRVSSDKSASIIALAFRKWNPHYFNKFRYFIFSIQDTTFLVKV